MKYYVNCVFFVTFFAFLNVMCSNQILKKPSVLISILTRNKAHTLPYTLSFLEKLNYPKKRIALWIYSDNNIDDTINVLETWLNDQRNSYFAINSTLDEKRKGHKDEEGIADWSSTRFEHIIKLREMALDFARNIWADFIFMLDADIFLTNPNTLDLLISKNEAIVAPLLKSDGLYSNFWAGMTKDYYYKRSDNYQLILDQEITGCFPTPMVHSAVLINLRRQASDFLTYNSKKLNFYNGPRDDIITFALSANFSDIPLHICNDENYGFIMVPLEKEDKIEHDFEQLVNLKLQMLETVDQEIIHVSKSMKGFITYPEKDTIGLNNIYMINLLRRPERRRRMLASFDELGINVEIVDAIDGRTLNESILNSWNIRIMPGYEDPFQKRPMKMGEVGCFLSHYIVWNRIIEDGHDVVLVLEDDAKFEPYFRQKLTFILHELEKFRNNWDLVYLGRKILESTENRVEGSQYLVYAGYSYWTIGYLLSFKGAKKLIESKPLENLIPVDEYLPIMYDRHPRNDWKNYFEERKLIALSAEPLILFPTHYTGDNGYISDTENSILFMDKSYEKEEL